MNKIGKERENREREKKERKRERGRENRVWGVERVKKIGYEFNIAIKRNIEIRKDRLKEDG